MNLMVLCKRGKTRSDLVGSVDDLLKTSDNMHKFAMDFTANKNYKALAELLLCLEDIHEIVKEIKENARNHYDVLENS